MTAPADIAKVLNEDGCVVIADLAAPETMDQIRAELEPYLAATGGGNTDFLGETTRRTGALIARSPTARSLSPTRRSSTRSTSCSATTPARSRST